MEVIKVGIADYKVAKNPARLVTVGLGSCVGVSLYDPVFKVGGLLHIMLPKSSEIKFHKNKAKFADTAIPMALRDMVELGAQKINIVAKLAGGAKMFSFISFEQTKHIGERNVIAAAEALKAEGIAVVAMDTGGNMGRTMKLDTSTGKVIVKTISGGVKEL
jgi:chemotaxis protein CheD